MTRDARVNKWQRGSEVRRPRIAPWARRGARLSLLAKSPVLRTQVALHTVLLVDSGRIDPPKSSDHYYTIQRRFAMNSLQRILDILTSIIIIEIVDNLHRINVFPVVYNMYFASIVIKLEECDLSVRYFQ